MVLQFYKTRTRRNCADLAEKVAVLHNIVQNHLSKKKLTNGFPKNSDADLYGVFFGAPAKWKRPFSEIDFHVPQKMKFEGQE